MSGLRKHYDETAGLENRADLWEDWRKALENQTLALSDVSWINALETAEATIANLQPREGSFRRKYGIEPSVDLVDLRDLCREKVDQKEEEPWILDDLLDLHLARLEKNTILTRFANRFRMPPRISQGAMSKKRRIQDIPFDVSRTFAILIGINKYTNPLPRLLRAKQDAQNFWDYLKSIGVPPDNVRLLLDEDATRERIVDSLYDLRDDPRIETGDPIIIWYSGHGSSYATRGYWEDSRDTIEAMVPVDRGDDISDISDREINLLLADLETSKGNNITVVFDCCFSGGLNRESLSGALAQTPLIRRVDPVHASLPKMLEAAESHPRRRWPKGRALKHPNDWRPNSSSHVLIAACQSFEVAYENDVGGVFTTAFLHALRTQPLQSTSYTRLVDILGYIGPQQRPLVAGDNIDCSVFQIQTSRPSKVARQASST